MELNCFPLNVENSFHNNVVFHTRYTHKYCALVENDVDYFTENSKVLLFREFSQL